MMLFPFRADKTKKIPTVVGSRFSIVIATCINFSQNFIESVHLTPAANGTAAQMCPTSTGVEDS